MYMMHDIEQNMWSTEFWYCVTARQPTTECHPHYIGTAHLELVETIQYPPPFQLKISAEQFPSLYAPQECNGIMKTQWTLHNSFVQRILLFHIYI